MDSDLSTTQMGSDENGSGTVVPVSDAAEEVQSESGSATVDPVSETSHTVMHSSGGAADTVMASTDVLRNVGDVKTSLEFYDRLRRTNFFASEHLWKKHWMQFENGWLKPYAWSDDDRQLGIRFDRIRVLVEEAAWDEYLKENPDTSMWRKEEWLTRIVYMVFYANRSHESGIFHSSGPVIDFKSSETVGEMKMVWEIVMKTREQWKFAHARPTPKKTKVLRIRAWHKDEIMKIARAKPEGDNRVGGQLVVFWLRGKVAHNPQCIVINSITHKTWTQVNSEIVQQFNLTGEDLKTAKLAILESIPDLSARFSNPPDQVKLSEVSQDAQMRSHDWHRFQERAVRSAEPIFIKLTTDNDKDFGHGDGRIDNKRKARGAGPRKRARNGRRVATDYEREDDDEEVVAGSSQTAKSGATVTTVEDGGGGGEEAEVDPDILSDERGAAAGDEDAD